MTEEIKIGKKDVAACNYCKACEYYKQPKRLEQENKRMKSALEEISLILDELKQQYDYMENYPEIEEIQNKINEVLNA